MSTVKQQSNPRVMMQKAQKAQRLLNEIVLSIGVRDIVHPLWDTVSSRTKLTATQIDFIVEALEDVRAHNAKIEASKI